MRTDRFFTLASPAHLPADAAATVGKFPANTVGDEKPPPGRQLAHPGSSQIWRRVHAAVFAAVLAGVFIGAGPVAAAAPPRYRLVVTTSLLECALIDLLRAQAGVEITRLIPPGNCPGHFDISPQMLAQMQRADLLVRHDYQEEFGRKYARLGSRELRVGVITSPGSFLIPDNYASLLQQLQTLLAERFPELQPRLAANLQQAGQELQSLSTEMQAASAAWKDVPAIVAQPQLQFAKFLGFNAVGTLPRPSDMRARDLQTLLQTKPALIIGNLQSDAAAARQLGKRMDVPVAVLSNFPGGNGDHLSYRGMALDNLQALQQAWPID